MRSLRSLPRNDEPHFLDGTIFVKYISCNGGKNMSDAAFKKISSQIDMLSYKERILLLNKIVSTLHSQKKAIPKENTDFESAFGLWKDRDVSIDSIRQKAWGRS